MRAELLTQAGQFDFQSQAEHIAPPPPVIVPPPPVVVLLRPAVVPVGPVLAPPRPGIERLRFDDGLPELVLGRSGGPVAQLPEC